MAGKKSKGRTTKKSVQTPRRTRGRPTKLNAETRKKVCEAILVGATYEAASQYAGITYETFNEWMKAGNAATAPDDFSDFSEAVTLANAQAQVTFATHIKTAATAGDWRAAAWMLERRFPKAYGQRVGAIDEKSLDDAIEAELARIATARQTAAAGEIESPAEHAPSSA